MLEDQTQRYLGTAHPDNRKWWGALDDGEGDTVFPFPTGQQRAFQLWVDIIQQDYALIGEPRAKTQ